MSYRQYLTYFVLSSFSAYLIYSSVKKIWNSDQEEKMSARRETRSVTTAKQSSNYKFYSGEIASHPSGDFIDDIHRNWFGDYSKLEVHHGYIQWLFSIFESKGMNFESQALTKAEAKLIRDSQDCAVRIIRSYKLMLDFYGMRLVDIETGEIKRAKNYKSRYENLSLRSHNFLRITRIIISLGELGFRKYKQPFVEFLSEEVKNGALSACKRSLEMFWKPMLNEKSAAYIKKTLETSDEDREESVFFRDVPNRKSIELEEEQEVQKPSKKAKK
eukprot:TRINITY_DN5301_c0_g1_i1.p1 TRINITY_DN5301_c0_g1~~TRINITY_DN5301_c0_g1_i1.p1  ORF type:complete len:273 (+),score=65.55 TRINITY_DN5301_c0_g1_i1:1-819(+)